VRTPSLMSDDFEPPKYKRGKPMPEQYQLAFDNPGKWVEFDVSDPEDLQRARGYISSRRGRKNEQWEQWELRSSVKSTKAHVRFTRKVEP
jgi:hypothetical protein